MPDRSPLDRAIERLARAATATLRHQAKGHEELPHQRVARQDAAQALDAVQPHATADLRAALETNPALPDEAAKGRTAATIRAMQLEAELRINPELRADRFVTAWQLRAQREKLEGWQNETARARVEQRMIAMGKKLERDRRPSRWSGSGFPSLGSGLPERGRCLKTSKTDSASGVVAGLGVRSSP